MRVKTVSLGDSGTIETQVFPDEVQHLYVGGLGVAAKLMSDLLDERVQPLAPDVPLIVSVGPLNATGFPAANRVMFYSVSPATGLVSGTWMGGQLGTQLAKTGTPNNTGLAELVIRYQNAGCVRDSLITCTFVDGTFGLPGYAPALEHFTGLSFSADSLNLVGERIFNLERLLNLRQGVSSSDDVLPKRLLEGEAGVQFAACKQEYYRLRGWDDAGRPTAKKLAELGLAQD